MSIHVTVPQSLNTSVVHLKWKSTHSLIYLMYTNVNSFRLPVHLRFVLYNDQEIELCRYYKPHQFVQLNERTMLK